MISGFEEEGLYIPLFDIVAAMYVCVCGGLCLWRCWILWVCGLYDKVYEWKGGWDSRMHTNYHMYICTLLYLYMHWLIYIQYNTYILFFKITKKRTKVCPFQGIALVNWGCDFVFLLLCVCVCVYLWKKYTGKKERFCFLFFYFLFLSS